MQGQQAKTFGWWSSRQLHPIRSLCRMSTINTFPIPPYYLPFKLSGIGAWNAFQAPIDDPLLRFYLTIEFLFLDLNIAATPIGSIETSPYGKPLNLNAYLPSHSAQPPRVLRGLANGMLYRFKTLNTRREEPTPQHIQQFYRHLLHRGIHPMDCFLSSMKRHFVLLQRNLRNPE